MDAPEPAAPTGKIKHYWKAVGPYKEVLHKTISAEQLVVLSKKNPAIHLAYAGRQFAIVLVCSAILFQDQPWWIEAPLIVLQGFTFFNMTTLLHEVVHSAVFKQTKPGAERALGLLYAITSGISASQFTRWHLDHHDGLGTNDQDPKRHWLSPKRNKRWFKLLYCTPALMPIYFRAAAQEAKTYPAALRALIARERTATTVIQLSVGAALYYFGGLDAMLRVWFLPYFLVFPVAFTLNRLGQHYNIDPTNPLKWSTVMKPSGLWEFLFVYSNYHAEHHYFPRVPFYNLRKLHMILRPMYADLGIKPHTYREIIWQWFVLNRAPHTNWDLANSATPDSGI
ncbi:MAG: fatty acid desaturase [Vicinamibacteria bacterium]|nr:fatty acid desaturase [Vicinamibacteria bacterium]